MVLHSSDLLDRILNQILLELSPQLRLCRSLTSGDSGGCLVQVSFLGSRLLQESCLVELLPSDGRFPLDLNPIWEALSSLIAAASSAVFSIRLRISVLLLSLSSPGGLAQMANSQLLHGSIGSYIQ